MSEFPRYARPGHMPLLLILSAALALSTARPAHAADVAHGAKVFRSQCAECHSNREGKNKTGPSLFGIIGRKAASVPGYRYSDAMKSSMLLWTDEELDAYVTEPRKVVPGNKMKYRGLTDAAKRADLIAYLDTLR
jgi:cytochrome c